ncbi:myosin-VIIa-like isoform X2 [Neocloeon triangulifer]|uniref:myosin-VIIa-like isoform X2 n=1 Tax=Neocloeon triangulifer TaxID=2078957 RepID=UPI00286ED2C0|nr:myosin-VIIa-like isoform X2 [Neocloeon triangulifer]
MAVPKSTVDLQGEWVWIKPATPGEFEVPIGARIVSNDKNKLTIKDDEEKTRTVSVDAIVKTMHQTSVQGVEDMISLGDLHEPGILRNLQMRYKDNLIYTYTGSILVAINPYKVLPIYTQNQIKQYRGKKIGQEPPHIFAVGDNSFSNMQRYKQNQCIVISGESGAGKTESTKLILQFLAAISGRHSWIEQQILEANPILEAFGNAKTIRNDNSSRFGKFIDIHFNKEGVIEGAKIEQYLLEKSRIVAQSTDERNYHIFYCMLAGLSADDRKKLELQDASHYKYLTGGGSITCEGRNDAAEFAQIRSAMKVLMFTDQEIWDIMKLLAALLHIGNIRYKASVINNLDATEIPDETNIKRVSNLLGVSPKSLVEALTTKSIFAHGETVVSSLSKEQSMDVRDAFVKGIYGQLFILIVDKINNAIYKPQIASGQKIGVLDIFGFENFNINSFEQFCINYANESLQQFFVQHIFKLEQEAYSAEGISWKHLEFQDNQHILDMIAMKPMSIMSLIDEESKFPKGTDQTLLNKVHSNHQTSRCYLKPKSDLNTSFGLEHFAGVVFYDTRGFLEKNRDTFSTDLRQLVHISTNRFLAQLFDDNKLPNNSRGSIPDTTKRQQTLSAQFKRSLDALMRTLYSCQPFFVRCIKPNEYKKPQMFDRALCCRQLRYSGMMETIRIRKAGYPIRHAFKDFVERYRILVPGIQHSAKADWKHLSNKICGAILGRSDYQLGHSKVFLKDAQDLQLEQERGVVLAARILILQRCIKGWIQRRRYQRLRAATVKIQTAWRGYLPRKRYLEERNGWRRLQACITSRRLTHKFTRTREKTIRLQARCRGYLVRKTLARREKAIVKVQAHVRRIIAQKQVFRMRYREQRMQEIRRLRKEEEARFKKDKMEKYKEEAEKNYKIRVQELEKEMQAQELDAKWRAERNNRRITEALRKREAPIDHSQYVSDIFGFLEKTPSEASSSSLPSPTSEVQRTTVYGGLGAESAKKAPPSEIIDAMGKSKMEKDDLEEYSFQKFASTYFQGMVNHQYSRKAIKPSLLKLPTAADELAAQALWITILRFCGDLPEPRFVNSDRDNSSVMQRVQATLGRSFTQTSQFNDLMNSNKETIAPNSALPRSVRGKLVSLTLRRKNKLPEEMRQGILSEELAKESYQNWLNSRPTTNLEKLHFIIGHGILRSQLRDEIYSQICKQLTNNPSKSSHARGWILLSLCVGCFAPSDNFNKYLKAFIRQGPPGYAPYCEGRLQRTMTNGTRTQPPSWLELQATKSKEPIILTVTFMDGSQITLRTDSATTASELVDSVANKIGLKDRFGFSLFIALFDKVSSLGSGGDHVMDAVSQCEQYAKEQGAQERNAPWRLFFRKEIFAPWHDPSFDPVATNLIYQQVVRGIKYGEYRCDKEEDIAMLAAQQYFIDHGANLNPTILAGSLPIYLPDSHLVGPKEKVLDKWSTNVTQAFKKSYYVKENVSKGKVKEDIVTYARLKWPLLFSRFFEVFKVSGATLAKNDVIIAVNWTGLYVVDDQEQVLLELSFPEITDIITKPATMKNGQPVSPQIEMHTAQGQTLTFNAPNSEDLKDLLFFLIGELRKLSRFAVALQDYTAKENNLLTYVKGDLIYLEGETTGEVMMKSAWGVGRNRRTNQRGDVASHNVYILPTLREPPTDVIALFLQDGALKGRQLQMMNAADGTVNRVKPHTLMNYAAEHFRMFSRQSLSKGQTLTSARGKNVSNDELWRHSREPLKQPLLKKLVNKDELAAEACFMSAAILKYMGDLPSRRPRNSSELTDSIFDGPLNHDLLRDEVYCQIMKQLTGNTSEFSTERGWELMWLASGLFACSTGLLKELTMFLRTRKHPLAQDSLQRLQKTLNNGQRKYPPHPVEVEAIQHKTTQIFHKVYFPDDTDEAFEVDSSTRARDLCGSIAKRLNLVSADGFSLFVKIADKVISVPDTDFFFDFVRYLTDWMKRTRPTRDGVAPNFLYQIIFMRKLWTNVFPGKDKNADQIFHYHQEVVKLLRGYHKCGKDEAVQLAALIYRVNNGVNKNELANIGQNLKDYVPSDMIRLQSSSEWKKAITSAFNKSSGLSKEDAKTAVLKILYQWPTFGSAFFEVKQTSEPGYPEIIIVAINKNGISLINPQNKEILITHSFNKISNWSSGNTYFHVTIGNLVRSSKLLCETPLGYKMDDLLTSYIASLVNTIEQRSRNY